MPDITADEHGARKLRARIGPDPSDEFSQDAAENRKLPLGVGLSERLSGRTDWEHHAQCGGSMGLVPPSRPPSRPEGPASPGRGWRRPRPIQEGECRS